MSRAATTSPGLTWMLAEGPNLADLRLTPVIAQVYPEAARQLNAAQEPPFWLGALWGRYVDDVAG